MLSARGQRLDVHSAIRDTRSMIPGNAPEPRSRARATTDYLGLTRPAGPASKMWPPWVYLMFSVSSPLIAVLVIATRPGPVSIVVAVILIAGTWQHLKLRRKALEQRRRNV